MKKLNKAQEADKGKLSSELFDAHTALEDAITKYNETIEAAKEAVETAVTDFNEKLGAARDFCEQIVSDMDNYESERSEKWQESDAASAFQDWKSEWESVELEDLDVEFPEALEVPENPQETLDGLPSETSS
jgi:DNA repair exonuclease SbcCD ATPase subunit